MSWILPGDIGNALMKGGHENLRVMGLPLVQRVGEGEIEDTLVIFVKPRRHTADALKAVHAGAAEHGYRRADDIAAMVGIAGMPCGAKADQPLTLTAEDCANHYALIAVISTFV